MKKLNDPAPLPVKEMLALVLTSVRRYPKWWGKKNVDKLMRIKDLEKAGTLQASDKYDLERMFDKMNGVK